MEMKHEFHTGDRVVVRPWEDMAADYRMREHGIYIPDESIYFTNVMAQYCGREFVVKRVIKSPVSRAMRLELYNQPPYSFSPSMFYLAGEEESPDISVDSFLSVLCPC